MAKAKRKSARTTVKKNWYPILAPRIFNRQAIGDIALPEAQKAVGRIVKVNLGNLTGDMKKQNVTVAFKIIGVADNKLQTEVIGYKIIDSMMKRFVKRGKNRVDCSFIAVASDGSKMRIKTIMITGNLTHHSSLTDLRNNCEEDIKRIMGKESYENILNDIANHRLQSILKKRLSKIYPLRLMEIRELKLLGKGKAPVPKKEEPKPEGKAEEPKEVKAEAPKKEEPKPVTQKSDASQEVKAGTQTKESAQEEPKEEAPKKEEPKVVEEKPEEPKEETKEAAKEEETEEKSS